MEAGKSDIGSNKGCPIQVAMVYNHYRRMGQYSFQGCYAIAFSPSPKSAFVFTRGQVCGSSKIGVLNKPLQD
jgi:hypothetical protein